jgi:hypothetical protein
MKWFPIASGNPTSSRSPQTGASAASTSSLSGKKLFRNWKDWVSSCTHWEALTGESDIYPP